MIPFEIPHDLMKVISYFNFEFNFTIDRPCGSIYGAFFDNHAMVKLKVRSGVLSITPSSKLKVIHIKLINSRYATTAATI
jgi:hypothetical protein